MYETFPLQSGGVTLAGYRWDAAAPGAFVCLLHGAGETAARYERLAGFFSGRGISTLSMDLRGHGRSPGRRGHMGAREGVLQDVDCLLACAQEACGGAPVVLYGHSLGGNIALDYRERGLLPDLPAAYLVSSPWLRLYKKVSAPLYYSVKAIRRFKPDFQLRANVDGALLGNRQVLAEYGGLALPQGVISAQTALESYEIAEKLLDPKRRRGAGENRPPLILMHGTADRICSIEGARTLAAMEGENCIFLEWDGYGHELHHGNRTETGMAVMEKMAALILEAPALRKASDYW
ncbi:MAG: lysophospholipase [Clostridiales Family XIII bacterium]|nr:lysophospholipase [Clostridiales Family XIII bacterium]